MIRWLALLLTSFILTGPAFGADLDGTLKKIKGTNTITLGYRESLAAVFVRGRRRQAGGVLGGPLYARRCERRGRAGSPRPSGEMGQGHGGEPDAIGRRRHNRPRVRLDDRLAVAPGAGGLQPPDLHRRRQLAGHGRLAHPGHLDPRWQAGRHHSRHDHGE